MNKVPQQNVLSPNLIVKSNIIVGLLSYLARWLYLLRVSAKMLSIRSFDLFVAAMALLILAPLLLIVVCCIFIGGARHQGQGGMLRNEWGLMGGYSIFGNLGLWS